MLNKFRLSISNNKNLLMLVSTAIYVCSLIAVLYEHLLLFSLLMTIFFIVLIIKNCFPIKYVIIWTLLFYLGVINTSSRLKNVDELLNLAPVNSKISGTIISIPQGIAENKPKFFFKVNNIEFDSVRKDLTNEKVLVTMNSDIPIKDLKIYNSGILTGRLAAPFKAGNPSQFDYSNYLRNHDTYAVFYAKTFDKHENPLSFKAKVLQKISDYREKVIKIHSKYLPSPNLEILGGIVFGDDAVSPPKEIKKSFANSGLLHILAASGMNVAFIYGFFFWVLSCLRVNFKLKVITGMIMVLVYSLMTGLGASIIRATGMLLFVLLGKLIDRDAHSISLLSFVGLLMLLYNPLFINDVGFQLSFIVTFGILMMAPAVIRFNNKILDYITGIITIPIIAQLWVIPIQIFYFSNISVFSVFANIMSVPILAVLSFGGFISALLSSIAPIADFICKTFDFVLNPLLSILVNISDFWGHFSNSTIQTTHPSIFQILIYYCMLLAFTGFLYKDFRNKYKKFLLKSFITLLIIWLITLIPIKNSNLEIIAFDVGNADCFLIKTPENKYIMIDTGKSGYKGGKSQAEIIVLKYLKDKGIKNLESLIVTHFDNDHAGGACDVINKLKVKKVYLNDLNHNSYTAKNVYKTAKLNKTEVVLAQNNQLVHNYKDVKLKNFVSSLNENDNENSIISLLEYKDFTMLFTGDMSAEGLNEIKKYFPRNITVFKVPHHGAKEGIDKEIINHLSPKYSLISVGENKFGHPSLYTIKLLENTEILRTDINNSILIKLKNNNLNILTFDTKLKKYINFHQKKALKRE